ncbi:VIT family protein [Arsenicicoccus piscis]|uniref:VIT1/CCC1 transporter family protein n=1 Tax=Arsenicicoccus piscis TaxID=673954 RepID=UPI001F4D1805|nr:VIT family protein [Arsenicicoccus piscis]
MNPDDVPTGSGPAPREVAGPRLPHPGEQHEGSTSGTLNWLRAGVLGANDGIVSVSGLVIGVAASGASHEALLTAGIAAVAAGALSMAVGEYVSVSTQRDTESALLAKERRELAEEPEAELAELTAIYEDKGLEPALAAQVAEALTAKDALAAHAESELKIDHEALTSPWQAAFASLGSFVVGAVLPLITIVLLSPAWRVPGTVVAAALALGLTGYTSARLGGAAIGRPMARNVLGGLAAMAVTYAIGSLVGTSIG